MQNGDGKRPRIRPAVSNRYDNSTYYEYIEQHTGSQKPMAPGQQAAPGQPQVPPTQPNSVAEVVAPSPSYPPPSGVGQVPPEGQASAPGASSHMVPVTGGQAGSEHVPAGVGGFVPGAGEFVPSSGGQVPGGVSGFVPQQPHTAEPDQRRPKRGGMWIGVAAVGLVMLLVAVFVIYGIGPNGGVEPAQEQQPQPVAEPTEQSDIVPNSPETAKPKATSSANQASNTDAKTQLDQLVKDSEPTLKELEGKWVVQLSAKQVGTATQGKTWDESAILDEFRANGQKYGDVALLWSSDWSSFRLGGYWVTVIPKGYDSPDPALEQCRAYQLDRDNCFAKLISTTQGPEGSTKLND